LDRKLCYSFQTPQFFSGTASPEKHRNKTIVTKLAVFPCPKSNVESVVLCVNSVFLVLEIKWRILWLPPAHLMLL